MTNVVGVSAEGSAGRPSRADALLAGGLAVVAVAASLLLPGDPPYRQAGLLAPFLAALSALLLLWRRSRALWALAGTSLVVVVNAAAGFGIGVAQWPPWIALFTCFAVGGPLMRITGTVIASLAVAGYLVFDRGPVDGLTLSGIAMCFLIATLGGDATRTRRASEARLARQARERAAAAELLLLQERSRLARELHDSLGHTVNVMVMQAGVGRRVFAEKPAFAREALERIETMGREALGELDRLLRVLHPDERDEEQDVFEPTVADVEALATRIRATGRQVQLRTGEVRLAASGARAVYRIVQEALTNAVRHTSSGQISVDIRQTGAEVEVVVHNEARGLRAPVPGRGLVNMRERARLEGGRFDAGPVADGFEVRAVVSEWSGPTA